jgi:hypothetical protein
LQHRIARSYEADKLEKQLEQSRIMADAEREANAMVTAARQKLDIILAQKGKESETAIRMAIRDALRHVPKNADCDYDAELTGVLNRARGHGDRLPSPPNGPPDPSPTAPKTPG